ncbi:MAG: ABC transporter ATP-binding protein/permease [Firmicutes bacterium]|nr:ABC transporter ATP-binding protein/permease [Bacillota bacterium]
MFKTHLMDKKIKKYAILSFVLFIFIQLVSLISPIFMKEIIDIYLPESNVKYIILATVILVSLPFIIVISQTVYNYLSIKFARNRGNEIAIDLLENVVYQELDYFKKQNSMELVSYLSKEAVTYVSFYIRELPKYFGYIIISIITLVLIGYYNPIIGLVQLIYIPLSVIPIKIATKKIDKEIKFILEKNAVLMQKRTDLIKGIEYIKLNTLENSKLNDIKNENNSIVKTWGKVAALDSLTGFWSVGFTTALFSGLTFGLSALLYLNQNSLFTVNSLGTLIMLFTYSGLFYNTINNVIRTQLDRKKQEAEFSKMMQFYDLEGEREKNVDKVIINDFSELTFKNCSFSYDRNYELKNISFNVCSGDWIGIEGDSGSGKTTILNLISKLYEVTSGEIKVNNINISEINSFYLRKIITKISQDIFLFPGSIYDNFKLINKNIDENLIFEYLGIAELVAFIQNLPKGIYTDIGEMGKLISGGEKQRLSLAIGLSRQTPLIMLDEVTANLDVNIETKIRNNIFDLMKKNKLTIISVSHRNNFHMKCNKVIHL